MCWGALAGSLWHVAFQKPLLLLEEQLQRQVRRLDGLSAVLGLDREQPDAPLEPPLVEELRRRLTGRGTDSAEVIAARMARAQAEISHWDGYDYVVVNDDIDACYTQICQILAAERLKRARQTGLIGFVRELTRH